MVSRRQVLGWTAAAGLGARRALARARDPLAGKIFYRGDAQYEALRLASTWNARKADRYPPAIVFPQSDQDVAAAVRLAKQRGWQVTTRSGGHSWTASHTREHAMQINLAHMKTLDIDADARTAVVSPSWQGQAFNQVLREQHRLIFPAAHCVGVGLGGFVLAGGHGWNRQVFGLGCENLLAVDVVTAEGELIHADEHQHRDYLWAARGAGPGFFGVVTRMHLKLHPIPPFTRSFIYVFPPDVIEAVVAWLDETAFLDSMEATLMRCTLDGKPTYKIRGGSFGYTQDESDAAAAIFESCPVLGRALVRQSNVPAVLPADTEAPNELNPTGARFFCDGAWVNGSASEIYRLLREAFAAELPTPRSRVQMGGWRLKEKRLGDMAYSITGRAYVSPTAVYYDPSDDARCGAWVQQILAAVQPIKIGSQMNDENMPVNPGPYLSASAARHLETLRAQHDPQHRFTSFPQKERT